ncbi:MAG: hypothetical protein KF812_08235, partial [Fimbriimonadaceae bacterium]|nr:hypothetical protein [Fimbriimonadaceae bacterium]
AMRSWVARFAPLVMDAPAGASETRERLRLVEELRGESSGVDEAKSILLTMEDADLVRTYGQARSQLASIERDLRRRLAEDAPGDPESEPAYDALQDRLAETAARIEMGVDTYANAGEPLEIVTSPANWTAGGGMLIFGLGWNAFTTFHATLMIGGMWAAFGPGALALLLFYAIFWSVGIGMLVAAFFQAASEKVRFDGNTLEVEYRLGPFRWSKRHTVNPRLPVITGQVEDKGMRPKGSGPRIMPCLILTDDQGRPIHVARSVSPARRDELCRQFNQYLTSLTATH